MHLADGQFQTDAHMKQAIIIYLDTQHWCFQARIQALVPRWDKCLRVSGDYVVLWCVRSATYEPYTHKRQKKILGNRAFTFKVNALLLCCSVTRISQGDLLQLLHCTTLAYLPVRLYFVVLQAHLHPCITAFQITPSIYVQRTNTELLTEWSYLILGSGWVEV